MGSLWIVTRIKNHHTTELCSQICGKQSVRNCGVVCFLWLWGIHPDYTFAFSGIIECFITRKNTVDILSGFLGMNVLLLSYSCRRIKTVTFLLTLNSQLFARNWEYPENDIINSDTHWCVAHWRMSSLPKPLIVVTRILLLDLSANTSLCWWSWGNVGRR